MWKGENFSGFKAAADMAILGNSEKSSWRMILLRIKLSQENCFGVSSSKDKNRGISRAVEVILVGKLLYAARLN